MNTTKALLSASCRVAPRKIGDPPLGSIAEVRSEPNHRSLQSKPSGCLLAYPRAAMRFGVGGEMVEVATVLIVGGGIAGLRLARALHREALSVELIERSSEWRAEGGAIAVQPNGMRALRTLGLDDAVERSGQRLRRWSFCDEVGELLSENDLEALWGDVGPFIGIERTRLQQILVAGVEGVRCRLGTSVLGICHHNDRVSV